ncbi:hypothetical protein TNCV_3219621 [Trichonephila clavipes]|nr:hypothetical protein TNCV_3219621 [Trichonephila clavipes]
MDVADPQEGTSTTIDHPGVTAPQKKFHVPPINIDNVKNQAALLQHLQTITKQKLEAKLIGTKFRIYPKTPYAYHQIRRYIEENSLESHTYMLPEDKVLRAVIRGLPIDMSPTQIIADLESSNRVLDARDFFTQANTVPEHLDVSSAPKITWRRIARSPLTRNQNAISVRESTLPTTSTALKILGIGSLKRRRERRTKKTVYVTPEPPKVNFWEQRAKTFAQRQQSTSTNQQKPAKPPTTSTHPSKQKNNLKSTPIFSTSSRTQPFKRPSN